MIATILYNFKRSLINSFCLLMDMAILFSCKGHKQQNTRKKILIIKTDNIGDFILWTDAAKEYKKIFSPDEFEITLLANSMWAELAKKTGYFDAVISLDRKKFMLHPFYRFSKMKEVITLKWHRVIYHSFSHEFGVGLSIIRLVRAHEIIAGPSDNGIDNEFWRNIVTRKINYTPYIDPHQIHELKKNAAFIRSLGAEKFTDAIPELKFLSAPLSMHLPQNYYVIFPGASSPMRKWSEPNFAELCNYIYEKTKLTGIVCGGKGEVKIADNIIAQSKAQLMSVAGKTNLQDLLTILEKSTLTVTNETSCVHMAAAVNVPVICLLGGGHFGRFLPFPHYENRKIPISVYYKMECFNCNWNCKYKPTKFQAAPCIENISLKLVIQSVNKILEKEK